MPIDPSVVADAIASFNASNNLSSAAASATPESNADMAAAQAVKEAVAQVTGEPVPAKVEEAAEPAKEAEPKKDPMASRFAALTRKEKEIRAREQDAERRAKAAEERERAADERAKAASERESRLESVRKNPYKLLKEQGISLQDVINDSLNQYEAPKEDPVEALAKAVEEMKTAPKPEVEELNKKVDDLLNELSNRDYQSAIMEVTDNIQEVVDTNPEKYELMSAYGESGVNLAKDVIREYFQRTLKEEGVGKLLSYEEACDIVEQHYESDEYLDRVLRTKKAKSRLGVQDDAKETTPKPAVTKEVTKSNTLTAKAATSASEVKVDIDKLSRDEAIAYLAKIHSKRT